MARTKTVPEVKSPDEKKPEAKKPELKLNKDAKVEVVAYYRKYNQPVAVFNPDFEHYAVRITDGEKTTSVILNEEQYKLLIKGK